MFFELTNLHSLFLENVEQDASITAPVWGESFHIQWKIISNELNTKSFKISRHNHLISIPSKQVKVSLIVFISFILSIPNMALYPWQHVQSPRKKYPIFNHKVKQLIHVDCHCTVFLPNFKIFPSYFLIKISRNVCRRLMHLLSIRWHIHFFVTLRVKAGFYFIL